MAFTLNPVDGHLVTVNNIVYQYDETTNSWDRVAVTTANVITTDTANVVSNISSTSTTTGALKVAGGIGVQGNVFVGAVYTDSYFYANGQPFISEASNSNIYNGTASASDSSTLIDSISTTNLRSVKWTLSAIDNTNSTYKSSTIDAITNGVSVYYNEYGIVLSSAATVVEFTVSIVSGNLNLYATGDSSSVTLTYQRTTLGADTVPGYVSGAGYIQSVTGSGTATTCVNDSYTGTGSQVNFTLSATPTDKNQTIVSVGGILQPKSTYSLAGAVITLSSAPAAGTPVEVQTFVTTTITGYTGSAGPQGSQGSIGYTGSAGTGAAVQGYSGSAGGAGIAGNLHIGGTTFFNGDLIPTANNTVNLGSPTARFGTLYISANTIDIGGATISSAGNTIQFTTDAGNVTLDSNTVSFLSNVSSQGPEGARGYTGSQGDLGYTGSRGSEGFTGSQGSSGSTGFTGSTGSQGIIGYTGSAGISTTYATTTVDITATVNTTYLVDTTGGNVTITLPGSPAFGQTVGVIDGAGTAGTNQITVLRNGNKIQGLNIDLIVNNNRAAFTLVYFNSTNGWVLTSV